ncbi:hypothetical protein H8E88_10210 [candidate division KSB1 bacterium]|nr:hypothetical protein [candidate division KSB1 bacterium]
MTNKKTSLVFFSLIIIILITSFKATCGEVFQNKDCLRCHNDLKQLMVSDRQGKLKSLVVDSLLFNMTLHGANFLCVDCHIDADTTSHPNTGYTDVNCMACHSNLTGLYPPNAKETLRKKELKIPEEKIVGEKYLNNKHGLALQKGDPEAPQCYDCHTQHYVRAKTDPTSSVYSLNLAQICLPCHKEAAGPYGFMNRLADFKIQGHRKENLAERYTESNCQGCHYGDSAHGEEAPADVTCHKCHLPDQKGKKVFFGPLHANIAAEKQPVPHLTASLYWILAPFVVLGLLIIIGFVLFKKYRIKEEVLVKLFPPPGEK